MTDFAVRRNLSIGEVLTQAEVEDLFQTDFGYQFKGITYRHPDQGKYIILMANEGEIYNDDIGQGSEFIYEGEGDPEKGDQKLTIANKALRDAIREPIPVYFFESEDGVDEYEYQGLADVTDSRYVSDGNRMVYRFEISKLNVATWEDVEEVDNEIEQKEDESPELTEEIEDKRTATRPVRSRVFSRKTRSQYDYSCAVCGSRRFSPDGNPEVEAAHIYPKSEKGADDLRNGIALCRLHHWAFDSGWISVTDQLDIIVKETDEASPPDDIDALDGDSLSIPDSVDSPPHPTFLQAHRELYGFE